VGSPYATGGSSGGSAYATGGTTGSPYATGTSPLLTAGPAKSSNPFLPGSALAHQTSSSNPFAPNYSPPAQHHGGIFGFLHDVGHVFGGGAHWAASKADLAAHDIKSIPGGLVKVTKDVVEGPSLREVAREWEDALLHGNLHSTPNDPLIHQDVPGLIQGTEHTIQHPLADPFQTLLTVGAIGSGIASAGSRLGYASDAARAGDTGSAVKALVSPLHRPPVAPRVLDVPTATVEKLPEGVQGPGRLTPGVVQVPLHASHNPLSRLVQKAYDHVISQALVKNPEGRLAAHAMKRVGGSISETERALQRTRLADATALDRSLSRLDKGVTRAQAEAALRLASENSTPAEAAAFHESQAAAGVGAKANREWAAVYKTIEAKGLLTTDAHGDVIVNGARYPGLAAIDAKVAHAQDTVDTIAQAHGVMTEDALQARKNGPARIREGGRYVAPTAGKLGKPSPALLAARANVARLEQLHEKALARATSNAQKAAGLGEAVIGTKVVGPGASKVSASPAALDEATARLTQLEKEHNAALDEIAAAKFGPVDAGEVARRNAGNAKAARQESGVTRNGKPSGASGAKARRRPTVVSERRALIEREIGDAIAARPNDPTLKKWAARSAEIDRLRELLYPMIGETPKGILTGPGKVASAAGSARAERLGSALSVARDKLERLEAQHAARIEPTGIVGGAGAREGRGYVSYKVNEPKAPRTPFAKAVGPVVGKTRSFIGKPSFTGHGLEHGVIPNNTTRLVASHLRSALRFVNTDNFRRAVLETGSEVRRSSRDILVRVPDEQPGKITAQLNELLGKTGSNLDDTLGRSQALADYLQQLIPGLRDDFQIDRAHGIGTKAPAGYKWVDRNALGDLAQAGPPAFGRIARTVNTINSGVTAATVYFKVGHIFTRSFTNAAANIIQGSARPGEIAKTVRLWQELTPEERLQALGASGTHSVEALPHEGTNAIARGATKGAQWWARRIDAPFRFNSVAYAAREGGYTTPAAFREWLYKLQNPEGQSALERSHVIDVAKRANREAIAYDRLGDFERRYLARVFWFYPWTRGAVSFAVNTFAEHPWKSAVLGAAGNLGREYQAEMLGPVPSFEQGLIALGGGPFPTTTDLSTFSPFATAGDVLELGARPGGAAGFLNPVFGAALTAGTGVNQYGRHTNTPVGDAFSQLFQPTPEAQILSTLLHPSRPTQIFQHTPEQAVLRSLFGPAYPRPVNVPALNKSAAREQAGR
jgi:hypothetical protein